MASTFPDRPQPPPDGVATQPSAMPVFARRYAVELELGRGGMGRVYRARDLKIGRAVAVKVLAGGGQRERFEQEARAAGALNHPNIVAIYDVGEHGGEPYIVTELLEGETLREVLENGPLAPDEVLDFGIQLADGAAGYAALADRRPVPGERPGGAARGRRRSAGRAARDAGPTEPPPAPTRHGDRRGNADLRDRARRSGDAARQAPEPDPAGP